MSRRKGMKESRKIDFQKYLTVLGNFAYYLGVVDFRYDRLRNTFNCTKFNVILSSVLIAVLALWHAAQSIGGVFIFIELLVLESIVTQQLAIQLMSDFVEYLPVLLYVWQYLISKRGLLSIVMDMLKVFRSLKDVTLPRLYYRASFAVLLHIKIACIVVLVARKLWALIFINTSFSVLGALYAQVVCSVLDMGFVFSQLFLVCLYEKMTGILKTRGRKMSPKVLSRCVKRFLKISAGIHRMKRVFDKLFMPFLGAAFVAILWDVIEVNSGTVRTTWAVVLYDRYGCVYLDIIFNILLVHFLAGKLKNAFVAFQNAVMRLTSEGGHPDSVHLETEVEVWVLGRFIHRLTTWAYGSVEANVDFLWKFIMNVVAVEVIYRLHKVNKPAQGGLDYNQGDDLEASSEELGSAYDVTLDYNN